MCPPGQHQSQIGKERCLLCDPGTFAANEGQALCSPCGRGSYAPFAGMSSCLRCGNDTDFRTTTTLADDGNEKKWIEVQGAISESYCRCALASRTGLGGPKCSFGPVCSVPTTGQPCTNLGALHGTERHANLVFPIVCGARNFARITHHWESPALAAALNNQFDSNTTAHPQHVVQHFKQTLIRIPTRPNHLKGMFVDFQG